MIEFVVKFRIQRASCCGNPPYWISKQATIEALNKDAAKLKVLKLWSISNKIEIDGIEEKQ
jgi:hypothetical protein